MTRKFMKGSAIVDHLANNTIEDYKPFEFWFPRRRSGGSSKKRKKKKKNQTSRQYILMEQ
jgi:hypothetical protein